MTATNTKTIENGSARDEIIASIRSNLATSSPFDAVHKAHHAAAEQVFAVPPAALSRESLIAHFKTNLESVGGICTIAADENEAGRLVVETLMRSSVNRVAISDSALVGTLIDRGVEAEILENASKDGLFDTDIGITSAQWAIAETGTLVLESEKESHRFTSLVPPVHLCILRASTIRQTMAEILDLTLRDLSRTITFITGASRTSDIELTLAIGVHGPKELNVIVLADQ